MSVRLACACAADSSQRGALAALREDAHPCEHAREGRVAIRRKMQGEQQAQGGDPGPPAGASKISGTSEAARAHACGAHVAGYNARMAARLS
eukprot:1498911-Pleurochrysis_carterae.AAC.4